METTQAFGRFGQRLPSYRSHKIVRAAKISSVQCDPGSNILVLALPDGKWATADVDDQWLDNRVPKDKNTTEGYFVVYEDGTTGWIAAHAFERDHTRESTTAPEAS